MPLDRHLRFAELAGTALEVQLQSLGVVEEFMEPRDRTPWRTFPWLVVLHTRAGEATWETSAGLIHHRPGTMVALAPEVRHVQVVGTKWWQIRYLVVHGPWLKRLSADMHEHGGTVVLEGRRRISAGHADLEHVVQTVLEAAPGWDWEAAAGLAALLGHVQAALISDQVALPLAERLTRVIDRDLTAAWSVAALAKRLGMSVSSLAHRCVAETGSSPAAWVRRRRAERAKTLLATGLSVTATSERLGFANPYHFARVIRQEFGVPPSQLRVVQQPSPLAK